MKLFKPAVATATVAGVALCGVLLATPATADPVSPGYVAVGSDTLQASMNALTNGTNVTNVFVRVKAPGKAVGNFDAFGSLDVQVLASTNPFGRPAGSGAGVAALAASILGRGSAGTVYGTKTSPAVPSVNIADLIDIARSSSGPGTAKVDGTSNTNPTDGLLQYIPYARDAVAYAYRACNSGDAAVLSNLTQNQLTQIYQADTAAAATIDGVAITPVLPQESSGTRSFFLTAINTSTASLLGDIVIGKTNTTPLTPENDASVLGCGQIIPFSAASWIAQANGAQKPNTTAAVTGLGLGSPVNATMNDKGTAVVAPFSGTTTLTPNTSYYSNSTFGRDTYLVVEYARINPSSPTYDQGLAALVSTDPTKAISSLVSFNSAPNQPGGVKAKFGFVAVASPTTTIRAFNATQIAKIDLDENH